MAGPVFTDTMGLDPASGDVRNMTLQPGTYYYDYYVDGVFQILGARAWACTSACPYLEVSAP